ncbi:MAG: orotidine 5'-phosphate decarboxylase / HUMPS family protein [Candidatus Diapherotrites archaeon]|nr:orotidine 5'-phosphate decarboxylase / HUMPS family protein [Candidatus Diapherotrites archaeon]
MGNIFSFQYSSEENDPNSEGQNSLHDSEKVLEDLAKIPGLGMFSSQNFSRELDRKKRYLQIAFNSDLGTAQRVISQLPRSDRIIIEAGTPFIKSEGTAGIEAIRSMWKGLIVADTKTMDGATQEVAEVARAGANAATVLGAAPPETISLFVKACKDFGIYSMVDMLNVQDPLRAIMKLQESPDVVILHKGRDEEKSFGKIIQFKHIKRIRSKFDSIISVAGGMYLKEAQSAVFNGANIVVINVVRPSDPWTGIKSTEQITEIAQKFLESIE